MKNAKLLRKSIKNLYKQRIENAVKLKTIVYGLYYVNPEEHKQAKSEFTKLKSSKEYLVESKKDFEELMDSYYLLTLPVVINGKLADPEEYDYDNIAYHANDFEKDHILNLLILEDYLSKKQKHIKKSIKDKQRKLENLV